MGCVPGRSVCLHCPYRYRTPRGTQGVGEWHEFFLAQAGAAGVLVGLVFVGVEVLAVGLAAWGWVGSIQLLRLRSWRTMGPELRGAFVLRAVLGQAATLPFVAAGIAVLFGGLGGLYWLAAGMVISTLVALFGAWVLLVEINR